MVSQAELIQRYGMDASCEYCCHGNINLYDSPDLKTLTTQAVTSRQLRILALPSENQAHDDAAGQHHSEHRFTEPAIAVCLCEDDYPGWLAVEDLDLIHPAEHRYRAPTWTADDIRDRIPAVITYMKTAMAHPNHYLWGGALGPNYDCSGLVQAAFLSVGIWLPRDAYQQEAFTQAIALDQLEPGDLIFFGPKERANHVALYLGSPDALYIHSSGKDMGRNGIGIDVLSPDGDTISQAYYAQVHGAGRVLSSYQPTGTPIKSLEAQPVAPMH